VGDDNATVAEHVIAAVHVLGFHVSPKNWLPLVLQPLASPQSSQPHVNVQWPASAFYVLLAYINYAICLNFLQSDLAFKT
jgi:hypothetical protein